MLKFGQFVKISVFALGIAIFGLAPVAQAKSERRHNSGNSHNYSNHSGNRNYSRHSNRQNYSRHSNRRDYKRHSYRRHNTYSYGYNSYGYGSNYGYGGYNSGHGGDVVLGALTGGLLFYALTANQRNTETVYVKQQPVNVQSQQQWTQQQRPAQSQNLNSSCLQIREYQTTITVGSQTVPAYGQSCLQADGSWKLGPAIPEPVY